MAASEPLLALWFDQNLPKSGAIKWIAPYLTKSCYFKNKTKGQIPYNFTHRRYLEASKPQRESGLVGAGGWGLGMRRKGTRDQVSIREDKKVPERGGGDGCTARTNALSALELVKMAHFMY